MYGFFKHVKLTRSCIYQMNTLFHGCNLPLMATLFQVEFKENHKQKKPASCAHYHRERVVFAGAIRFK